MQNLKRTDAADPFGPESDTQLHLAPTLGLVGESHSDVPSPARVLQQRLIDDLNGEPDDDGRRWAPRTTLLVASGLSLALWGAIAVAIAALH